MITYSKKTIRDKKIKKIPSVEKGCWINVVNPTEEEIGILVNEFKLDKQNLISGLDHNELPRVDFVENDIYIFVKTITPYSKFQNYKTNLDTYLVVITEKFILTLSVNEPNFVKNILNNKVEFVTTQKLKCLIRLFFLINREFEKSTIDIVKIVNAKKVQTSKLKERDVSNLLQQEDILNNLVSSYYYMNLLYERLVKKLQFFEEDKEIIEDLIVEANQGFNLCKSSLKALSNIRDYYMISLSNKLNKTITILTIFTIFISIPAAISGIYGMNVRLPFQGNFLSFYYVLLIIAALCVMLFLYFKKKKLF